MLFLYALTYTIALYMSVIERMYESRARYEREKGYKIKDGSKEFVADQIKPISKNERYLYEQEVERLEREREERENEEKERKIQKRNENYKKYMENDVWHGLPAYF